MGMTAMYMCFHGCCVVSEAGDFDALLISELMPRLERFYAVEANQDLCERLEKNIRNIDQRNIQVKSAIWYMSGHHTSRKLY